MMKQFLPAVTRWFGTARPLAVPRRYLGKTLAHYYGAKGKIIYDFKTDRSRRDPRGIELVRRIKGETDILLTDTEAYLLYEIARKTEKIPGDIAEVGVYRGGSAKLIREATAKSLHLFDTFEGLPALGVQDNPAQFRAGSFNASLENVKRYLHGYPDIHFYQGLFPATAAPIQGKRFSFVHLDVDIYESTLACLTFFYSHMSRGGCIVSHDYPLGSDGVRKAFDEFFRDKPEIIIEPFATDQALVVKL